MEDKNLELLRIRSIIQVLFIFLGVVMIWMMSAALWIAVSGLLHYTTGRSTQMMQMSLLSALFIILWCGYLYYHSSWRVRPFDYRRAFTGKTVGSILGIGMGGCILLALMLSVLQSIFPQLFEGYTETMRQFEQGEIWITICYVLLIGPITEELIFRGAMFDRLRLAYPFWIANVLQALLFGVYHMNLIQGIYGFAWGILLGMIYQATGSILANILAHITFNATNYLLGWIFPEGQAVALPLYIIIFLLGVVFFVSGLWYTIRMCKKCKKERKE